MKSLGLIISNNTVW